MQPTRPAHLLGFAAAAFVGGLALAALVASVTGAKPGAPWATSMLLAFLVVVLLWAVWAIHRWLDAPDRLPTMDGLRAARLVVLAKAGSVFGALITGLYGAFAVSSLSELDRAYGRDVLLRNVAATIGGVAVAVCSVLLERACRTPPPDEGEPPAGAPA